MMPSFQELLELLGKSKKDPITLSLIARLGEPSEYSETAGGWQFFRYVEKGLVIDYSSQHDFYTGLIFHFETRMVLHGAMAIYGGDLISDVKSTDSLADVRSKLGVKPFFETNVETVSQSNCKTSECS